MNYPYQNPNYTYQTPNPNPPQQPGQFIQPDQFTQSGQPLPNSANAYSNPVYSYYPDGTLQPQPSGQRHSSRSPNTRNIPFPEPHQSGPVGHPQTYIPPSLTTPNLTVPTNYQHDRQSSHGSSYGSQGLPAYSAGAGSNTGGSNYYSQQPGVQYLHEGGYNATAVYEDAQGHAPLALSPGFPPVGSHKPLQSQSGNAVVYDKGHLTKGPPNGPSSSHQPCRYPGCNLAVFFDRRVNELREWCSDRHMMDAVARRVEKPCNTCQTWPRRNGYKYCSKNGCRYQP